MPAGVGGIGRDIGSYMNVICGVSRSISIENEIVRQRGASDRHCHLQDDARHCDHLFFERFVSKSRARKIEHDGETYLDGSLLADVDNDISYDRRSEVIEYIEKKYKGKTSGGGFF